MKHLTYERARELFEYDPVSGLLTRRIGVRGKRSKVGVVVGTADRKGYRVTMVDQKPYKVHRIAFLLQTGAFPEGEVDHINGVKSDNRWCNLRDVTTAENGWNRGKQSNNTSGFKGVSWHKQRRKWRVKITVHGNQYRLGLFSTLEEANACYQGAASLAHGDYKRKEQP